MKRKKTFRTRCETARDFPIEKALAKLGHFPTRTSVKEAWVPESFQVRNPSLFQGLKAIEQMVRPWGGERGQCDRPGLSS